MTAPACYHCGLPVGEPGRWRAPVLGAEREFCCPGCEAVATTIADGGFAHYYETRTAPAVRPVGAAEGLADALAYDDPQ